MKMQQLFGVKISYLFGLLLFNSLSYAQKLQLQDSSVMAPQKLGKINLLHDEKGFSVVRDGITQEVKSYWVDQKLRNITSEQLKAFQKVGYIRVNQLDNGDFCLKPHTRGLGGGMGLGYAAYWTTKITGYGVYGVLVWTSGGEALLHATETMQLIELAANSAFFVGVAAPTV